MITLDFPPGPEIARQRAAAYVRMSTEHQQYSTCNQLDVINGFARQRHLEIEKVYSDEGKSGLKIKGRAALSQMIGDVLTKNVNYTHILVYDVSRWGRFQDPDEAAHYEFICREAGVSVHYCAEQFENDGGLTSTIAKSFKRAMAGEYSRELSVKVFQGACRMIRLGYKQGGPAIYGLRRVLVDSSGQPKAMLKPGERKNLQTDRVILVPGPAAEIEVVRWMFQTFVEVEQGTTLLAKALNERGVRSESGRPWSEGHVRYLLQNENYIGNLVYCRSSLKLRSPRMLNPPEKWIRKENAFEGIVSRELFFKAQARFQAHRQKFSFAKAAMLDQLRGLLNEHGYLSSRLISTVNKSPDPATFRNKFGSLLAAYRLVGFVPRPHYRHFELTHRLGELARDLTAEIIRQIQSLGATATWNDQSHILNINNELRVAVIFIRHSCLDFGDSRWIIRYGAKTKPDVTIAVRMDRKNETTLDYYLFPGLDPVWKKMRLAEKNGAFLDAYRFQTLDFLVGMAAHVKLP